MQSALCQSPELRSNTHSVWLMHCGWDTFPRRIVSPKSLVTYFHFSSWAFFGSESLILLWYLLFFTTEVLTGVRIMSLRLTFLMKLGGKLHWRIPTNFFVFCSSFKVSKNRHPKSHSIPIYNLFQSGVERERSTQTYFESRAINLIFVTRVCNSWYADRRIRISKTWFENLLTDLFWLFLCTIFYSVQVYIV